MAADNFFSRRWHGRVRLAYLLWYDMLGVGTLINLTASFLAFILLTRGAPSLLALALHLAPLPYNLFLLAAVWRAPRRGPLAVALALSWFALMLVV
jgi:hypothetical protein